MRVIPREISVLNPSAAERRVHRLLLDLEMPGWVALHSVGLSAHEYKRVGEIDFLLIGPDGLLVLEVKGGKVARRDGVWCFTDRFGVEHRREEGPFEQARSAAYSLRRRLDAALPAGTLGGSDVDWAAVFTDIEFTERSVEWDQRQVLDRRDVQNAAAMHRGLHRVLSYWRTRPGRHIRFAEATVERVVGMVRPDFEVVPTLRQRTSEIEETLVRLTTAQFRYLDAAERNPRVLCDGGAGTGKTFLAAETARRAAATEDRVLLTCRSHPLASFIAAQPGLEAVDVVPFAQLDGRPAADLLVVDEAQDLMNVADLALLDARVRGGLDGGRWRLFMDRNNQANVLGKFDCEALALIEAGSTSFLHLPENCRNTVDVVGEVVALTGADIGVSTSGHGPPVMWRWWDEPSEGAEHLAAYLTHLLDEGVDPGQVTVLTHGDPSADPVLGGLPAPLATRIAVLTAKSAFNPPRHRFAAARSALFKGLENDFICVTGLPRENHAHATLAELYVVMTRPRLGLMMCLPRSVRGQIETFGRGGR